MESEERPHVLYRGSTNPPFSRDYLIFVMLE